MRAPFLLNYLSEYYSKSADSAEISSISKRPPAIISALEALYILPFAHVQISEDQALQKAWVEQVELVDSFR